MSRSSKKGPFIDEKLLMKIQKMNASGKKEPIKTWKRASQISPEFVGHTILVHNGKTHISVFISESMIGHRLGEFSLTRTFRSHGKVTARTAELT